MTLTPSQIGIGITVAVLLCIGSAAYFLSGAPSPEQAVIAQMPIGQTHQIVLTDAGYEPAQLDIKKGDVVEFSSKRGFEHWPASNLHPTHNLYSEFDPQRPLASGEVWSFQFQNEGTWKYHDHLNSTFGGVITVNP